MDRSSVAGRLEMPSSYPSLNLFGLRGDGVQCSWTVGDALLGGGRDKA